MKSKNKSLPILKPIPEWCKKDCKFRDPKAKRMPACQFPGQLEVKTLTDIGMVCNSYKKNKK